MCFDAFRAPVTTTFQFEEYFRFIFGCYAGQLASGVVRQGPDLAVVGQLQAAFQRFAQCNTRLALLDCLTAASCSNGDSRWPVGHFVVFRESAQYLIYYLGAAQPKIILLVLEDQYGHPSIWMIDNIPLQGGQSVPRILDTACERPHQDVDLHAWLKHCDGKSLLITPMYACHQTGCLACFLAQIKEFEYCPWHSAGRLDPKHLMHFVCVQDDNDEKLVVLGWIAPFHDQSKFWVFHVIRRSELAQVVEHKDYTALPAEMRPHLTSAPTLSQVSDTRLHWVGISLSMICQCVEVLVIVLLIQQISLALWTIHFVQPLHWDQMDVKSLRLARDLFM